MENFTEVYENTSLNLLHSSHNAVFNLTESISNFENISNNSIFMESMDFKMYIGIFVNIIALSICVLGLFQNILCLQVLSIQKEKTSTEIMFIGVCALDVVFIIASMLDSLYNFLPVYFNVSKSKLFIEGLRVIYAFSRMETVTLLVSLSIERVFAVLKPFELRLIWTPKKAIYINVISYSLSFVLSLFCNIYYKKVFGDVVSVVYGIGIVILIPANVITVWSLCKSSNILEIPEKQLKVKMMKERRLTKVLVILTLLFITSSLLIFLICYATTMCNFNKATTPDDIWFVIILPFMHISGVFFSIFNSVIFVNTNKIYRNEFHSALFCC